MIAVLVIPGPSPRMHGLDSQRTLSLLPVGDRPMLQHIVDALVSQGVKAIEFIVGYAPERVEALLGNGDRWGCKFRYHLSVQPERPYRSLKIIAETRNEDWMLVHAERFPCVEFPRGPVLEPIVYISTQVSELDGAESKSSIPGHSGGAAETEASTVIFPAGVVNEAFANQTPEELSLYLERLVSAGAATAVRVPYWIDVSTPAALLDTQTRLFGKKLGSVAMGGMERQPGIWISRNVVIHPSVQLVPPVYIGPNSRLNRGVRVGPNAVISGYCIVDSHTVVEDSLVKGGSYIGQGLELKRAVVDHNLLVNVSLGTSIDIFENFLLGGVVQPRSKRLFRRGGQSILAIFLSVLLSPVSLLAWLYFALRGVRLTTIEAIKIPCDENSIHSYALPALGSDAWSVQRPAGWGAFVRQFLPGLLGIAAGHLSFVGLPPRTMEQIDALSPEWRQLYLDGKAGLITEVSVASTDAGDETQLYLADAYYAVKRRWYHDLRLATQYFLRLIVPAKKWPPVQ